jgi:hypothetical protein
VDAGSVWFVPHNPKGCNLRTDMATFFLEYRPVGQPKNRQVSLRDLLGEKKAIPESADVKFAEKTTRRVFEKTK